ncbi:MAG: hypothetical protein KY464_08520 [Gemmatimonadetes bacterium]|nr:hypothetical protein [Gemmatimonadota bacterium]
MRTLFLLLLLAVPWAPASVAQPIRLHPENPHYFLFRARPTVLVTSAEHYGAVVNPDFDYRVYLDALAADGLNYTRLFTGSYVEPPGAFGIEKNTLAPPGARVLLPWARSTTPGYAGGGNRFDLDGWDEAYFHRLVDFVSAADRRGIVVEVTLFSSIYGDAQWRINPLNRANNVNGTDSLPRQRVSTLQNGNLLAHQERMVRKIVRELNRFDNVIYEIQNEPWADNGTLAGPINAYLAKWEEEWMNRVEYPSAASLAWQRAIAGFVRSEEATLPNRHLIAQNFTNFRFPLAEVDSAVSILNFHYAYPEAATLNYGWDRVVAVDETGFAGAADSTYRRQAWSFMLAGGGLFNSLDYSFTVERPDGTDSNRAPGGGSKTLRAQLGVLKRFLESFDLVRMRPRRDVVVLAPGAFREALADPGRAYAVYLDRPLTGPLVLDAPAGTYEAKWVDVITGLTLKRERVVHSGSRMSLAAPEYRQDIALRLVAAP